MKLWLTLSAVITLLAAVLISHSYRQDLWATRARVASESRLISTPCGPIEYADVGSGLPTLVIHGAGGGFDQGLDFGRPLIENGFRVIAPSRFGYLRTPLPADASPMAQADAHACLLDALKLDKVAVFGGSAGAPSAMRLCLRHPEFHLAPPQRLYIKVCFSSFACSRSSHVSRDGAPRKGRRLSSFLGLAL